MTGLMVVLFLTLFLTRRLHFRVYCSIFRREPPPRFFYVARFVVLPLVGVVASAVAFIYLVLS
jgi:hypothetical protein